MQDRKTIDAMTSLSGRRRRPMVTILLLALGLAILLWINLRASESDRPIAQATDAPAAPWDPRHAWGLGGMTGPAGGADTPGRRLGEGLVLAPRLIQGQVSGYVIAPASNLGALAEARLRPGDMLIDIEGRPLNTPRVRALADELALLDAVEVTYEREGHLRKRVVNLRP